MITPEIAAFVVKEYLLPMFESDGKRLLTKKHNQKMRSKSKTSEDNQTTAMINPKDENQIAELMKKDYKLCGN